MNGIDVKPVKKTTMADIAKQLGVSKNSVSLALSGRKGVSEDLRKRVTDLARAMNYAGALPDEAGEGVCIAVILPEYVQNDIFFYSEILVAIDNEAQDRGILTIRLGVSKGMEAGGTLPAMPRGLRRLGILIVGVFRQGYMEALKALNLPILTVDIMYDSLPCVGSSNLTGGALATQHLIDLGHRSIGFAGPIYAAMSVYERWCGFNLAMRRARLPIDGGYNIVGEREAFKLLDTPEALRPYFLAPAGLVAPAAPPTAWFCAGDRIAIAMIHLLNEMGARVPDDVSVMGFDDISAAQMVLPQLSTMRVDRKRMGRLAVECLVEYRGGAGLNRSIPVTLVERDSARPPRKHS